MHKAFEYEMKYDRSGRPSEKRWSIGPVSITTAAAVLLALTGHTVWSGIVEVFKAVRWW
jgi:hypothetical protein